MVQFPPVGRSAMNDLLVGRTTKRCGPSGFRRKIAAAHLAWRRAGKDGPHKAREPAVRGCAALERRESFISPCETKRFASGALSF
jgi:hypothetical protein